MSTISWASDIKHGMYLRVTLRRSMISYIQQNRIVCYENVVVKAYPRDNYVRSNCGYHTLCSIRTKYVMLYVEVNSVL